MIIEINWLSFVQHDGNNDFKAFMNPTIFHHLNLLYPLLNEEGFTASYRSQSNRRLDRKYEWVSLTSSHPLLRGIQYSDCQYHIPCVHCTRDDYQSMRLSGAEIIAGAGLGVWFQISQDSVTLMDFNEDQDV